MKVGSRKGFSLIEIGIVMVVIGLIIAAVMKGKDVIKNAETKEATQNYVSKWINAFDSYYDKTGYNVNGSAATRAINAATEPGSLQLCSENLTTAVGAEVTDNNTLVTVFANAGMSIEQLVKSNTGNICHEIMQGENTQDALVGLQYGYANIDNTGRNMLAFTQVPTDVAKAIDKMIDATIDGKNGRVRNVSSAAGTILGGIEDEGALEELTSYEYPAVGQEEVVNIIITLEH